MLAVKSSILSPSRTRTGCVENVSNDILMNVCAILIIYKKPCNRAFLGPCLIKADNALVVI